MDSYRQYIDIYNRMPSFAEFGSGTVHIRIKNRFKNNEFDSILEFL